jgi:hypothetical protein
MPHFENSINITDFSIPIFEGKKILALFSGFFFLLGPKKLISGQEDMELKKMPFLFGLRILYPIQIRLLDFENKKNDSPYCTSSSFTAYVVASL